MKSNGLIHILLGKDQYYKALFDFLITNIDIGEHSLFQSSRGNIVIKYQHT